MEIKTCTYDDDNGAIKVEYADGRKTVILVNAIMDSLPLSPTMQSKLIWLLYNEPSTFAELFLSGELESYLAWHEKAVQKHESNLRDSLEKHYGPQTARQIAREFMMYDS